ncbi:TPA: HNH endonuclease [Aeromonas veronii]
MRPITRGNCPQKQAEDGENIDVTFTRYQDARGELIERLGEYCSFCEMQLDASLAVEHVKPKKPDGHDVNILERELDWENFLLACTNCNSTKGNEDVDLDEYVWPDKDNSFRALIYSEGGFVSAHPTVQPEKAKNIIKLVGLDKVPSSRVLNLHASDRRWLNRKEAWDMAKISKERYLRNIGNEDLIEQILDTVKSKGFWSVWMTVFHDVQDMRNRIIMSIQGTSIESFSEDALPIPRQGGIC